MMANRVAGVLLHVSSLPSRFGIGDLGPAAREFVDFLARSRLGIWQVLPLSPTGYGDSPYQSLSAFAGNPLFVDLSELHLRGWLTSDDLKAPPDFPEARVDFERVTPWHMAQLRRAWACFEAEGAAPASADFDAYCRLNESWLDDYALFVSLKGQFGEVEWTRWPAELVVRSPAALASWREKLAGEVRFHAFIQWCFSRQWQALKQYAHSRGVKVIGDVPIFVAHDSADVWANQSLFQLDADGSARVVAGVPPDYFSATGQLWGNPIYDWGRMDATGYAWWLARLKQAITLFDYVRLDHFRGFEAYWEIPAGAATAAAGHWTAGPGAKLFAAATSALGPLPLIAEDLGVITPPVEALRDEFGFPGMRVLQFAFGDDPKAHDYRPHHYVPQCAVYTGTHDNDTTVGWFQSQAGAGTTRSAEQVARERDFTLRYVNSDGREIHWDLIRLAMASVAQLAVFPMQDVLGLGSEARMNLPSTTQGNWRWRLSEGQCTSGCEPSAAALERRLHALAETYDRDLFPANPSIP